MRRPLPISSSCPSVPWIQYTVPCFWLKFWNSMSFSSDRLSWHYYSNGGRRQLNWSHWLSAKEIKQTVIRTDKTDRIVSRIVWNILSWIDRIKREYMDGWNRFLKRCSSNIEGSSPLPESWAKIYSTLMGSLTSTSPLLEREQSESGLIWVGESGSTV